VVVAANSFALPTSGRTEAARRTSGAPLVIPIPRREKQLQAVPCNLSPVPRRSKTRHADVQSYGSVTVVAIGDVPFTRVPTRVSIAIPV
jgi:hypothetical protein